MRWTIVIAAAAVSLAGMQARVSADEAKPSPEALEYFEKHVRPLLATHCYECHGEQKQRGGLRVDSREFLLKGTDNGPALAPGKPENSRLIEAIRYEGDVQMPPRGKLPQEAIDVLTRWVADGAIWPATTGKPLAAGANSDAWKQHWAFQPVGHPEPPAVKNADWGQQPIDRFVLARLEARSLTPSKPADRRALLRRLSFDLVGLPPTFEELEAFAADGSREAYVQAVDRLLASPHFGERWGRYWLDVSRYADTKGYVFQEDRNYPEAYTYRDWVVKALNDDMPYNRFVTLQIAADQAEGAAPTDQAAMGFLTLGRRFLNNVHDIIDDRIDVVCRGTMGLTVACARCHDHKYDPIPTRDYYSLHGIFASSREPKDAPSQLRLVDMDHPHNSRILVRGSPGNQGDEAPRQFLLVVAGEQRQPYTKGSGRLELAQSIVAPDNPLTPRVLVNRAWVHLFGAGLVRTPSDFGMRSDPPTHPELLDFLARGFVEGGWSTKHLIREMVLSNAYQQASDDRPDARAKDPENMLLWRMNRRRLDFESLRDSLLAASGQLDRTIGGPAVQLTAEPFSGRRSLYGFIDRQNLPGMFRTFDFASPDYHSPQRFNTTVPQQALFLLNSPFVMQSAERLVARPGIADIADPQQRCEKLFETIFSRKASPPELKLMADFIRTAAPTEDSAPAPEWQYGYGEFDENSQRTKSFTALPYWSGKAWQGGPVQHDPQIGWCTWNAEGGHPGSDAAHAILRRWIAPRDGKLTVHGRLKHPAEEGDGVRARVVSSGTGKVGEWTAQHSESDTEVQEFDVHAGDVIDFVVDCRTNENHDSFQWRFRVNLSGPGRGEWKSVEGFAGPQPQPLGSWGRLAQALLLSNEFAFVD